jgi:hypothetical protein
LLASAHAARANGHAPRGEHRSRMDQTFEKVDLYLVVSGIMSFTFFFATPEIGSGIQVL